MEAPLKPGPSSGANADVRDLAEAALDAWDNAIALGPDAAQRTQIRTQLDASGPFADHIRALLQSLPP